MDPDDLDRVFSRLGQAIGDAIGNNAREERVATSANITRLASAIARGGRASVYDRPKIDTTNQVLKAQTTAQSWAQDHPFDPDKHSVVIWQNDLNEKFTHNFCRDVIKYAGYDMYRRQSNDLHEATLNIENKLLKCMGNYAHDGFGSADCRLPNNTDPDHLTLAEHKTDAFEVFVAGQLRKQGPEAVALRKMAIRQLNGYIYSPVAISYDVGSLLEAVQINPGSPPVLIESATWYTSLKTLLQWVYDHDKGTARQNQLLLQDVTYESGPNAGTRITEVAAPRLTVLRYVKQTGTQDKVQGRWQARQVQRSTGGARIRRASRH